MRRRRYGRCSCWISSSIAAGGTRTTRRALVALVSFVDLVDRIDRAPAVGPPSVPDFQCARVQVAGVFEMLDLRVESFGHDQFVPAALGLETGLATATVAGAPIEVDHWLALVNGKLRSSRARRNLLKTQGRSL